MNGQNKTYTRVEHFDGGDGNRYHYIAQYVEDQGGNRYDTNWYRVGNSRKGFIRNFLDAAKEKLFFWHLV